MLRRVVCSAALFLFATSLATATPNVLFIAVDDLRPELGCYGASYAQTSNLDALAKSAVVFKNHFVQVPTCGASRYALLTGRSPANSGVTARNNHLYDGRHALRRDQLDGAQSLPELFRRSGYRTVCLGKISHTPDGRVYEYNGSGDGRDEVPLAWDDLPTPFGPWKRGWGTFFAYAGGRHRESGHGHRDVMEFVVENDDDLPDGLIAAEAVRQLELFSKRETPFFLGVGFFKPHLPFVAPRKDWESFQDIEIPPPENPDKPKDSAHWHGSGEFWKYDFPFPRTRPMAPQRRNQCRRAYLACVRYTDRQIGRVLSALDQTGLAKSTIVVVWGDHGWNLGDSQMWAKHTPFERAVRSPLIIRVPGMANAGRQSDSLVETTDIFPTLVGLCKPEFTTTEHSLDGQNLEPILEDISHEVRSSAVSYWKSSVSIRTHTHRLVVNRVDGAFSDPELYSAEYEFDPVENIAANDQATVKSLLHQFKARHGPTE